MTLGLASALQDSWDPPAEEGLYDIRVGTVCTKKGGYTRTYTPIVTGRVGNKAPMTLAVDMADAEKRTASSTSATAADVTALDKSEQAHRFCLPVSCSCKVRVVHADH